MQHTCKAWDSKGCVIWFLAMLHSRWEFFSLSSGEELSMFTWFSTRIRMRTWVLWLGGMQDTCKLAIVFTVVIRLLKGSTMQWLFRCYWGHLVLMYQLWLFFFLILVSALVFYFPFHWQIVSHQQFLLLLYSCLKEASLPSGWQLLISDSTTFHWIYYNS